MNKASTINIRIPSDLKNQAESILHAVGLSRSEAIRIFYSQICLRQGLPFEVKIPNNTTLKAIEELESGKGTRYSNTKSMWDDVGNA